MLGPSGAENKPPQPPVSTPQSRAIPDLS